jgi:hypothetical protein
MYRGTQMLVEGDRWPLEGGLLIRVGDKVAAVT